MSLIKKIYFGSLSALLFLICGIVFLLGTTSGLHMLIKNAARCYAPDLGITSIHGGWNNLTLKGVKYYMPGMVMTIEQVYLSLDLSSFKSGFISINSLTMQDINVVLKTQDMAPSIQIKRASTPIYCLNIPYPIILHTLALHNVKISIDDAAISISEFCTGAEWRAHVLTLISTKINSILIDLPKISQNEQFESIRPITNITKKILEEVKQTLKPAFFLEKRLFGKRLKELFAKILLLNFPEISFPMDVTIKEIKAEHLQFLGKRNLLITHLLLRASTRNQVIQLDDFDIEAPHGKLSMQGNVVFSGVWPINIVANSTLNIEPLKSEKITLKLGGELRKSVKLALNLSGPVRANLSAQACLAEVGMPIALTLQSKQLKWPLQGRSQYHANNFNFRFIRKTRNYTLSTRVNINGKNLPQSTLNLDGNENITQFKLDRLRLTALQGNADLTDSVDWNNVVNWNAQLTLSGINSGKQWPRWPFELDGKIHIKGSVHSKNWQLQIPVFQLHGSVKKNKIMATGALSGNASGKWQSPGICLLLGPNKLHVSGNLDKKNWNLDANINAPRLDGTLPWLGGTIQGMLKFRGNLQLPQFLINLTAFHVKCNAMRINRIKIYGDARSTDQMRGHLVVRVEQLKKYQSEVRLIAITANGSEKKHQMKLDISSRLASGHLAMQGSFNSQKHHWYGSVNNTRFDTIVGEWYLDRPMMLNYLNTTQKIKIGPHCWKNTNAELCVPKNIEAAQSGEASLLLKRFDLEIFKPLLRAETTLIGVFSGRADITWKLSDAMPLANVFLIGKSVKVVQKIQGAPLPVSFDTLMLNAALSSNRAQADWLIKINNNGQVDGYVYVEDPQAKRNISGIVNVTNISLSLIKPALMQDEKAAGILNANLRLDGNMQKPMIFGRMSIDKVNIQEYRMPFETTSGQIIMNFNGDVSTLKGLISTPRGQFNLAGNADWRDPHAWRARLIANGNKLRVMLSPLIRIDVSPDIVFEATPNLLSLNGSLDIPWARISVQELPECAVRISSDEAMLSATLNPIQIKNASIPIDSNLTVHIGNDVQLKAFGLKASIDGHLKVMQGKKGLGLNGEINVSSGYFHAYGQNLIVHKGQLIFGGSPEKPVLNIEAIRNPESTADNVIAGVRVTGSIDASKLEVFSDPIKSQQEAWSYLLRGDGIHNSGADSNAMTSMLIGVGVAKSAKFINKIGEVFGVSNLALDTQGIGESSQIVVSGYVFPSLQVKYGIGIFDSLATLTLRYHIMPKLYLEAISGIDQALDLLYRFEI